ncbi:transposase, IS204/IS1001/IS1096/IS1165 family protein [Bifidobacterium longum subsp. longum]|nr:transposase [Bifidobacterium longum]TCF80416.1 transposase, IS204/IS1001/IS1096/IS1165 family protein [Bifidobacterium longum subsp. longum]
MGPHAVEVLDPFRIVKLAGDKLTAVRCRLQRERAGRRGTKNGPLRQGRRVLLKTEALRADKQKERAARLLDDPANPALRLTHGAYRKIVRCYAQEDKRKGRGIALGFRSLDNYVTRSLLHTGGFRHAIQAHL